MEALILRASADTGNGRTNGATTHNDPLGNELPLASQQLITDNLPAVLRTALQAG